MNYPESQKILEEIKKANKILLNCHQSPDADLVASVLSMYEVLTSMGKEIVIISPEEPPRELVFLKNFDKIKKADFDTFSFSDFDLFLVMDTSSLDRVIPDQYTDKVKVPIVVIDNHRTNNGFGKTNLLVFETSSVCEILYLLYKDWGVEISMDIANALLAGIISDTGSFQYEVYKNTFSVANDLLNLGADIGKLSMGLFYNKPFRTLSAWGEFLKRFKLDEGGKFVWTAISYKDFKEYKDLQDLKGSVATLFSRMVEGTDFGIVIIEKDPGVVGVSLRSRSNFDVSKIAVALGGGGHKGAAAATIQDTTFQDGENKILEISRKVAKEQ